MDKVTANKVANLLHKVECIKDYEGVSENAIMEDYCLDYFNRKNVFHRAILVMKPVELFKQHINSLGPFYFDVI